MDEIAPAGALCRYVQRTCRGLAVRLYWGKIAPGKKAQEEGRTIAQVAHRLYVFPQSTSGCQFCGLALNEGWAVECMTHFIVIHDFARNQSAKTLGFELTPLNRTEYVGGFLGSFEGVGWHMLLSVLHVPSLKPPLLPHTPQNILAFGVP